MIDINAFFNHLTAYYCCIKLFKSYLDHIRERHEFITLFLLFIVEFGNVRFSILFPPIVFFDHLVVIFLKDVFELKYLKFRLAAVNLLRSVDFTFFKFARDYSIFVILTPHALR